MPQGPRGDTDGRGQLSDSHAVSRNVDVAAGSSERRVDPGDPGWAPRCCDTIEGTGPDLMDG
ncbi:hypothetical protein GCM10010307_79020 [Streptomyces vastus]|uniref:Uncharacterized protein n=1 Tax=Streptomyces vastus TaxID=285451 RepID=A0ABP6E6I0_9ACTN